MYFDNQPIITDFNHFVGYIRTAGTLELTKSTANLRAVDLLALNGLMRHPIRNVKNKPVHKDFILLTAFYYIGLSAEMWVIRRNLKGQFYLAVQPSRLSIYDRMTDDERYGFLLQAYWCYFDMEAAYNDRSPMFLDTIFTVLSSLPVGKETVMSANNGMPGHRAVMLSALGLFDYSAFDKAKDAGYWIKIETATLTEIGQKLLPILGSKRLMIDWVEVNPRMTKKLAEKLLGDDDESKTHPMLSDFFLEFKAAYPDWKVETRLFPIERPVVTGFFTFKISLTPKCYRVIVMHSGATLEELHLAIQEIFDFDNDHLYAFYLNGRYSNRAGNVYSDPRADSDYFEYSADMLALCELGLFTGQTLLYIFDFGDNWAFNVEVTDFVASNKKATANYKLKETVGEAPSQYQWNDD